MFFFEISYWCNPLKIIIIMIYTFKYYNWALDNLFKLLCLIELCLVGSFVDNMKSDNYKHKSKNKQEKEIREGGGGGEGDEK